MENLGRRIKLARNSKGLTAEEMASFCGVNSTYLRQIEGGDRTPSLPVFLDICNCLEVSPVYLLQDSLSKNEFSEYQQLLELWDKATPNQIKMVLAMIEAALKNLE